MSSRKMLMIVFIFTAASLFSQVIKFEEITPDDVNSTALSANPIIGDDSTSNLIPAGTIIVYQTTEGRKGKLQISAYGIDLSIDFVTYNADGSLFSSQSGLIIRGSYLCDLDAGVEVSLYSEGDFFWHHMTDTLRSFEPANGALFAVYDPAYNAVGSNEIQNTLLSTDNISCDENPSNMIPPGIIVVYTTNEGRFGKFKMIDYGYSIKIKWTTFNPDGSIYSTGGDLLVNGTMSCDLDLGKEVGFFWEPEVDFFWNQESNTERSLAPQQGSMFGVYDPEFYAITFNDITNSTLSGDLINGSDDASNEIPDGTILVYQTNEGRWGKLKIIDNDCDMWLKWQTFDADGSLYSEGGHLIIRGTFDCDLDEGIEQTYSGTSDFFWDQVDFTERYLAPQNGALFGKPVISGVELNENETLQSFMLYQNYPNPFNPVTTIKFNIPSLLRYQTAPFRTTLKIYDALGNLVAQLLDEQKYAGSYEIIFDASRLSSGVYFYQLNFGNYSIYKKMVMLK